MLRRIDHDGAVKPDLLLHARMAVVPVGPRLPHREVVDERLAAAARPVSRAAASSKDAGNGKSRARRPSESAMLSMSSGVETLSPSQTR